MDSGAAAVMTRRPVGASGASATHDKALATAARALGLRVLGV